ncbi:MAG: 23S rRNA (adenine(2503)-C(2))-methyltransferase RlmN [Chloroflexi bacterium]|nr:23S rRNA (adenine(2503)-C(2))-methyltransferase RlmN [Chloroflexota bacterium]
MNASLIFNLSLPELTSLLTEWDEPTYRARQIWQGLYHNFWNTPKEFTILPASLRQKLSESLEFNILVPTTTLQSSDGETIKTLCQLHDGKAIETVLMKYDPSAALRQFKRDNLGQGRRTLCISTQVGCAMGCVFCATGQMGFKRHLSSGEIVAQVMYFARLLHDQGEVVTNVVLMGMGEPFHNYDNTMAAIDRLNDPDGYNFGARRLTISTVGLVPAIRRFTAEKRQVHLAISLHAADDTLRTSMLPINNRYPIKELLEACRDYITATGRRITFEWAMVNGVNDTPDQAHLLASKLKGLLCHVNAIPLNPTEGYSGKATTRQRANEFIDILSKSGIPCTIRLRRGIDIKAGCGQLVSQV